MQKESLEVQIEKPFEGNMFEYEGGMMYFPGGIDAFCVRNNVELVEITVDGSVWCLKNGDSVWKEYPFEPPTTLSRVK